MSEVHPTKLCQYQDCVNRATGRYCAGHARQKRLGQELRPLRPTRPKSPNGTTRHSLRCEFPECGKPQFAGGLCNGHNTQRLKGKTLVPLYLHMRERGTPPRIIFIESACPNPDLEGPCHLFTRGKTSRGYGQIWLNGNFVSVHRYVWERDHGPIPEGLVIDHRCRNRSCCNVKHLRVVTMKVNLTENVVGSCWQLLAAKTHCKRGHPFDEANTLRNKKGHRSCRACFHLHYLRRKKT